MVFLLVKFLALSSIFCFLSLPNSSSTVVGKNIKAEKTIYTNSNYMVMGACKIIHNDANILKTFFLCASSTFVMHKVWILRMRRSHQHRIQLCLWAEKLGLEYKNHAYEINSYY